uniref:Uncharacterized protein n=1 Tax=Avena sativa TaxID=4498 RepID=A0ACD5TZ15_AVESA
MERFLVSASTGAMTSLLGKLGTILIDEYKLLKDVRDDIEFLKDELEAMQAFLLVMADVEEPDHQAKLRVNAIRDLSYDIEDKIDRFVILMDHEPSSKSGGSFKEIFNKSMKKIKNIKTQHKIAKDVKDIKIQVKEVSERYTRYKKDESSWNRNVKVDPRIHAIYKDASQLVGVNGPRDDLVKWLSNDDGNSTSQGKVVSIVGSGGLGKTTLVRQVYDKLGANYECRAFVSISRSPDMMKILSSILYQVNPDCTHAGVGDTQLIIKQIRDFLKYKRYLIIIDDIWDIQTWQTLDCALSKNNRDSVIMTTTRIHDVAKSCCSSEKDLVYKIKPLSVADSKKLFFKRIFGCEGKCPPNLKEASEDILKRCGGLPLAINAISSLLATGKTNEEWNRMRCSSGFGSGTSSDIDAVTYILSLSYFDLPLHLRSCLLYLTLFPEDYEIGRQRLVHRWISEGLVHCKDGRDLVELGETYFHELVNRCLIQPVDIGHDGKAPHCRVHDTILDFLIYKSTEENFCTLLSNYSLPDSRVRRLSLMGYEDQPSIEHLDLSRLRSLGCFGFRVFYLPSLVKLSSLRVLDVWNCRGLSDCNFKDIGRLSQLRYLNISFTDISELPRHIGDLEYLETLDASATQFSEIPESLTRLKRLVRLFIPDEAKFPEDGIGNLKSLQEFGDVNTFMQSPKFLEELGELTNLRKLSITWNTYKCDKVGYKEKILVSSLCKLEACKLRTLRISFYLGERDCFIGHSNLPALHSIREVYLCGGKLCQITQWMHSLVNLEKLWIGTNLGRIQQQDIDMVGCLPSLLELELYPDRCVGPIVIGGGFQRLQKFMSYCDFTVFMFEVGAMPCLKRLRIQVHLDTLKSAGRGFDFGIKHLSSLDWISVSVYCSGVSAAYVEAAESAFKNMVEANPNRPTLEMQRQCTEYMLEQDGQRRSTKKPGLN